MQAPCMHSFFFHTCLSACKDIGVALSTHLSSHYSLSLCRMRHATPQLYTHNTQK